MQKEKKKKSVGTVNKVFAFFRVYKKETEKKIYVFFGQNGNFLTYTLRNAFSKLYYIE